MKARMAVAVTMLLLGGAAASAAPAQGFVHNWSCSSAASAVQCYDYQGQQYVDWAQISAYTNVTVPNLCAKSITAAGNVRSNTCSSYTTLDITCYTYDLPESWAYVYWSGSGSNKAITGRADQAYCD